MNGLVVFSHEDIRHEKEKHLVWLEYLGLSDVHDVILSLCVLGTSGYAQLFGVSFYFDNGVGFQFFSE